jgi:hypothetical protein
MTLVVGVHLGDTVGVLADTRVTVQDGSRTEYFDNALKVYQRPPLIIGMAGNAISSNVLATRFQLEYLVSLASDEAYARSVDADWMIPRVMRAYSDAMREGIVDREDEFALILAAENSVVLMNSQPTPSDFMGFSNATISASVPAVSLAEAEPGQRLVFVVDFPSGKVEVARPGGFVIRGSGAVSEVFLRTRHTVLHGRQLSFGDRLASIAWDMVRAAEVVDDASFNSAVLGWARCRGHTQSVLHSLASWPKHSVSPEVYAWEPLTEEDIIPHVGAYCVGSDLRDFELGWILDIERQRKLRVKPIGPEGVRVNSRYILSLPFQGVKSHV